ASYVACGAFDVYVVGAKVDRDVQSTFQQVKVLIPGTEQGLQIWSDLKLLVHRWSGFILRNKCEQTDNGTRSAVSRSQVWADESGGRASECRPRAWSTSIAR